jgi:hypothetical protein
MPGENMLLYNIVCEEFEAFIPKYSTAVNVEGLEQTD